MITKKRVNNAPANRRPVNASRNITSDVQNRNNPQPRGNQKARAILASMDPAKRAFTAQLTRNMNRSAKITAATNTSNIMAKPAFIELLPMFVQNLLLLDVFGSVAMNSRQQLVPYFKFIAENTKGQTHAGDIISSPFVNRQGVDPNFTARTVKEETVAEGTDITANMGIVYTPILPGSLTLSVRENGTVSKIVDDGYGKLLNADGTDAGFINYSTGAFTLDTAPAAADGNAVLGTYQYDNETVGPDEAGQYGAKMAKGYLQLDEFNLVAEAREIACYWSVYSAFAAQQEYGANIGDMAKEAAISELTAELNTWGFNELERAASYNPSFNFDVAPVVNGSVVPSDYLNMFKLKLAQAASSIYQRTNLTRPNRLIVGTNVASYLAMVQGFNADNIGDTVGPYKLGTLNEFTVYVNPQYDPNKWVMSCKSNDIRRNSGLFGEYMPITTTDAIGLANMSVQQGVASMSALKVTVPETVVSGKILGTF